MDFLQERWADATARFSPAVVAGDSYETTGFLTSRPITGSRSVAPEYALQLVELPPADQDDADDAALACARPDPRHLMGRRTEAQLVQDIRDTDWEPWRRRRLTEALFYVGAARLAERDRHRPPLFRSGGEPEGGGFRGIRDGARRAGKSCRNARPAEVQPLRSGVRRSVLVAFLFIVVEVFVVLVVVIPIVVVFVLVLILVVFFLFVLILIESDQPSGSG